MHVGIVEEKHSGFQVFLVFCYTEDAFSRHISQNIIEKIWDAHLVHREEGAPDVLFIDFQLLHEVTSPQAFEILRNRGTRVLFPEQIMATIDHSIPTDQKRKNFSDILTKKQVQTLRENCEEFGIRLFDTDSGSQGIVHVVGPEKGLTQPGMTIVCGDSHTSTHGAFGALAFGIGTSQIAHVLETSCLLLDPPKTMRVFFQGTPSRFFSAKDAILSLIHQIGVQGGTGYILEYAGPFIEQCSLEERMTICNMSIECGARAGLVAPDESTFAFLKKHGVALSPEKRAYFQQFCSDKDASFDAEVTIDLQGASPRVSWGTTPAQSISISEITLPHIRDLPLAEQALAQKSFEYTRLEEGQSLVGVPIQHVFLGSCTNSRLSDLRLSSKILQRHKVAPGVRFFVVPGSEKVEKEAEAEGILEIFRKAGAEVRRPGCSACLSMNGDAIPPGERCASTSNRNFIGRQGPNSITHLMSPLMATIAGITGCITDPEVFFQHHPCFLFHE